MLVAAAGALFAVGPVAAQDHRTFGGSYSAVAAVGQDQVQVVYYRSEATTSGAVANVYLDREFITALRPGGYTAFCLAPGRHMLGSYLDDAPTYSGKNEELYAATFKGGATYYLKVREEGGNRPLPVTRAVASAELSGRRQQAHLLSRASKVEACRHYGYLDAPAVVLREYVLTADSAFNSRNGLSATGKNQVESLLAELQRDNAQITRVEVEGHTDPTGASAENQVLGQRWADIVRDALVSSGVPQSMTHSTSAGSRTLVKHGCYGSAEQQRACYAPNRRVVLRVETRKGPAS
ncbi:MAG: OmpA family protein [Stenotrophomonas sp.]